jgi:hypothetical protein
MPMAASARIARIAGQGGPPSPVPDPGLTGGALGAAVVEAGGTDPGDGLDIVPVGLALGAVDALVVGVGSVAVAVADGGGSLVGVASGVGDWSAATIWTIAVA